MNISYLFQSIKQQVPIVDAAEAYGIHVQNKKALCPFHSDTHPSLFFKDNFFKCFVCDAKGDVITLVSKLFNLTPMQAACRINEDYHLGLSIEKPSSYESSQFRRQQNSRQAFYNWDMSSYLALRNAYHRVNEIIRTERPEHMDADPKDRWIQALTICSRLEYFLDLFTLGTDIEKVELFKNHRKEVELLGRACETPQHS